MSEVPSRQENPLLMSSNTLGENNQASRQMETKSNNSVHKPSTTTSTKLSTTTSQSTILERTISVSNTNPGIQGNLLAGHLTGSLPLNISNSGLVPTTTGGQGLPSAAKSQSKLVFTDGQVAQPETQTLYLTQRQQSLPLREWSVIDVCHFLKYNDCSSYVEVFHKQVSLPLFILILPYTSHTGL